DRDELDVEDVVAQEKRLIISGASGMGKTTTLKWLTLVYVKNYLEGAERLIPLYVDLGRFKRGLFYDHVLMNAHENGLEEEDFKELLDGGKLVIFLDGLDLLGGSEDFEPVAEIQNFMSEFSRCKFVLSSRPGFFEGFKSDCKVSELVELNYPKINGYIHKYLCDGASADTLIRRTFDHRNGRLKSLCRNPMMLYLVIWLQKDGRMVDGRAGIYRESVEGIITHYREKGKTLSSNEQFVRDVLKKLAFSMQKENTVRLDYGGALDVAGSCISPERYRKVSAEQVLKDCFRLGLLHKDGDEVRFGFHQSFQEYFAAVKLKEIFEHGYGISESFSHPKWEDPLIFLSEITERPDELFDDVIDADKVFLAAKLTLRVGDRRVENLCARLLDKVDSRFDLDWDMAWDSFTYIGERAINALICVLHDEDSLVRARAKWALVEIEGEEDIDAIVDVMVGEVGARLRVRGYDADTMKILHGPIHKEKLESLLESDHEDDANEAFNLLYSLELKEQVKIKIFKKLKKKPTPTKVKSSYTTPSGVKDAEELRTDPHLGAFIDRLKLVPDGATVVDYGCGKGALLGRMKEIERELRKIHYIGVDISRGNRYLAGLTAYRYGVADKLKSCYFMDQDEFFSKNIDIDQVFFSHVIHEIFLKDLPEILYHLLSKMKAGSRITILEQVILVEPESDFVTWDADDFDMLFSGFAESSPRPYQTGRGHELISVDLERLDTDVDLESMYERCLEVYGHMKKRVLEKLRSPDLSDNKHRDQTALLANIESQIVDAGVRTLMSLAH
ncbi:MAG: NACHT domain-containing protein, partial [Candidatus Syntropharchaeales archaeon]